MKYSICVSGAAAGKTVVSARELAERLGTAIGRSGHVLTTGATVGLPYYAAKAAKEAGGMSIGFSPATSMREHLLKYRLPVGVFDFVNFTGMNYVGRDVFLVQSSDAVITVGGRIGSLHEFATALESRMPCGVLTGSGGAADIVPEVLKLDPSFSRYVTFDEDPERLVARLIKALDEDLKDVNMQDAMNKWFLDTPKTSPDRQG